MYTKIVKTSHTREKAPLLLLGNIIITTNIMYDTYRFVVYTVPTVPASSASFKSPNGMVWIIVQSGVSHPVTNTSRNHYREYVVQFLCYHDQLFTYM